MDFTSTRNSKIHATLSTAIRDGLAEDGGLYVPDHFPKIQLNQLSSQLSYPDFAYLVLNKYFSNDPLITKLPQICSSAFSFPIPLTKLNANTFSLELFHGPTLSFKDVGARFLAECLNVLSTQEKTTVIVATSGDTGSAVASAFYLKSNIDIIILYPKGKISARQQHQITCWDTNVIALEVDGTFDDCQRLVKSAFQDPWWKQHKHLSSANSINIGRLLPQMIYFAYSSMQFYHEYQKEPGFIVPTGNLGNATAAYWARMMGFPIREIVLVTNANKTIPDYLTTGHFEPRPSISTLANAMDVGNPSNIERLSHLFKTFELLQLQVTAISVSDATIKKTIHDIYQNYNTIICPHTATGFAAREQLSDLPWIIAATADASKFDTIVEPIIQKRVPIAPQLEALLNKPAKIISVKNSLTDIQEVITQLSH